MLLSSDGKFYATSQISFQYIRDVVSSNTASSLSKADTSACNLATNVPTMHCHSLGRTVEITLAGDLVSSEIQTMSKSNKGGDTIDIYLWIQQIGTTNKF